MPTQHQRHRRVAQHVPEVAAQHRGRVASRRRTGCAHRGVSVSRAVAGGPVRAKKTSSRSGVWTDSVVDLDRVRRRAGRARPAATRTLPSLGTCSVSASSSRAALAEQRGRPRRAPARVGELQPDVAAGDAALELVGGALGDQPPVVEHRDPVGELVGLVQVLGGEEDRDPVGDEVADDLPHGAAAARVEAGGRLVEEDDARVADQGHREVEPAPHAAGVGGGRLARPPRPGRTARAARRRAAGPRARPRWCRSAISSRFSSPVSRLSTAENWPVTPIAARTASGSRATSWPATRDLAAVGARSAWTGSARWWSCRRRWGRAARRSFPRRRPGRCRRARPWSPNDLRSPVAGSPAGPELRAGHASSFLSRPASAARRIDDVAVGGAGAHLDGLRRPARGGRRRPGRCARRRSCVCRSSQAAMPSRMPISTSPQAGLERGPRRARPRRSGRRRWRSWPSRRRRARSTVMLPLAAFTRRSPVTSPIQRVAVGVLDHRGAVDGADPHGPVPVVTSAWPATRSTVMSPTPVLELEPAPASVELDVADRWS